MPDIKLRYDSWSFDETDRLGPPGGFGEVFRGRGQDGDVAVKRLKLTADEAAYREMKIGEFLSGQNLQHVVPVLDYGQDADTDRYFLIMPRCEESLQDFLTKRGPLGWDDAMPIVLDIVAGLSEVGAIVHRDLKPGNVLRHEGKWKVADFGIAKFVEDSTSLQTVRQMLTPPYAAPEQWRHETPTRATDVYALGCILYAIMNGSPPFGGGVDEIKQGHLNDQPPELNGAPPRLKGLVSMMLRKSSGSRPDIGRCGNVFKSVKSVSDNPAHAKLAEAGQKVAAQEAEAEAKEQADRSRANERRSMSAEAVHDLKRMSRSLLDKIEGISDAARRSESGIALGTARIDFGRIERADDRGNLVSLFAERAQWDILVHTTLSVVSSSMERSAFANLPYAYSANLVFSRIGNRGDFRWREISFWSMKRSNAFAPFSLDPTKEHFGLAVSNVMHTYSVAHGPWSIDGEDEEAFQERCINLFSKAADGTLTQPSQMPPPASFFE